MLEQWTTLAPRLRASDVFRRAETGGRVGVLMSVVDEEGDGLRDLKLVQASNAAYDRLLGKALQNLQDSIHKCCIIAFIIGWYVDAMGGWSRLACLYIVRPCSTLTPDPNKTKTQLHLPHGPRRVVDCHSPEPLRRAQGAAPRALGFHQGAHTEPNSWHTHSWL